jgi:hypothetical protein
MNLYAARTRWGLSYLDHEGAPTIEMDLDLENGGLSEELFIDISSTGTRRLIGSPTSWRQVRSPAADRSLDGAKPALSPQEPPSGPTLSAVHRRSADGLWIYTFPDETGTTAPRHGMIGLPLFPHYARSGGMSS